MAFEDKLSMILTIGILTSSALMLIGIAAILIQGGAAGHSIKSLIAANTTVNTRTLTLQDAFSGLSGITAIYLGIMVLASLPVLTVAALLTRYIGRKDNLFIAISATVLFDMLVAIFLIPYLLH
ncbi:MAG: DUF1634 domain-containing protein [Candidatus Marsarchaeota archaeon]|jgi:uncharacterized membrane protein|nr:DUF1634 domain-containing protein [Candidatus Marsarchaeota archaeon]